MVVERLIAKALVGVTLAAKGLVTKLLPGIASIVERLISELLERLAVVTEGLIPELLAGHLGRYGIDKGEGLDDERAGSSQRQQNTVSARSHLSPPRIWTMDALIYAGP